MPLFKKPPPTLNTIGPIETATLETVQVNDAGVIETREQVSVHVFHQQLPDGVIVNMVSLPPGAFMMGSVHGKGYPDEEPVHFVHIQGFLLSQATITQRQWKSVMNKLPPCRCKGLDLPVDRVSWHDAQAFCRRLSKITGRPYRLPSEAEWEYACRAGSQADFTYGNMITTDLCNYVGLHTYQNGPQGIYRHVSTPAGTFPPNRFGIYDMHGNLDEWCMDTWHDSYVGAPSDGNPWIHGGTDERVVRGGSWHDPPNLCRSASRLKMAPSEGDDLVGIRIALSFPADARAPSTQ